MPRISLRKEDYEALAAELDLELIGDPPRSTRQPATWKCNKCGETFERPFHKMRYAPIGHRCQSERSLSRQDYLDLEKRFGIRWVGQFVPSNVRVATDWIGSNGDRFQASYLELGYDHVPHRLRPYLSASSVAELQSYYQKRSRKRVVRPNPSAASQTG